MLSSVQIGSIIFNNNLNYQITEMPGLAMPPIRVINYNLSGEHFGLFVSAFYGKRKFSLRGWVVGSSINDFILKRDALHAALNIHSNQEQTILFTLSNGRTLQIDAICVALDFDVRAGDVVASQFNIAFDASFPFLVGQANATNINLQTGGGGKVPPDTMPMALNADSGGKITIVNNGNGIFYPTVRISGPVTNPEIKNETLGKSIRSAITLATSSDYIDLDFKRKTITDNQGRNRYSIKSGDWWYLQPGSNIVRFLADTYDANALANITYRDSYLGI